MYRTFLIMFNLGREDFVIFSLKEYLAPWKEHYCLISKRFVCVSLFIPFSVLLIYERV